VFNYVDAILCLFLFSEEIIQEPEESFSGFDMDSMHTDDSSVSEMKPKRKYQKRKGYISVMFMCSTIPRPKSFRQQLLLFKALHH
jgi:hypothetical protein